MGKVFNPINTTYIKGSGSGTTDYNDLDNKPLINGVELVGDKTLKNLGIDLDEYYTKSETYSKQEVDNALNNKQDLLESGINIKAINGVSILGRGNLEIDTGTEYSAGDGIDITNDVISVDDSIARKSNYYTKTEINDYLDGKVDKIAGKGLSANDFTNADKEKLADIDLTKYYTKTETNDLLEDKQDNLESGVNIKTINNNSIVGSGNLDIETGTDYTAGDGIDITNDAISADNTIARKSNYYTKTEVNNFLNNKQDTLVTGTNIKTINGLPVLGSGNIEISTPEATETVTGTIKLNPNESVDMNANGQLTVGGRLGQFTGGGLYYPTTITPEYMGANDLLISEATNLRVESVRVFALFGGTGITLKKSAPAGSTTYEVSNTFANRFACACCLNGYATLNQQTAETNIVKVTSVKFANGNDISVYSGATESNNNIIITTEASANPDSATTSIRVYGSMSFDSTVQIGQGVGTGGVTGQGKLFALGQGILSLQGNSLLVGNGMYNTKNRSGLIGFQHINTQQGAFLAGQGHDTTNGKTSVSALGQWSSISNNTSFAVGNGTSNTARKNIFEITDDSGQTGVIMTSPNGTRYKITVDDSGNLTTTAI